MSEMQGSLTVARPGPSWPRPPTGHSTPPFWKREAPPPQLWYSYRSPEARSEMASRKHTGLLFDMLGIQDLAAVTLRGIALTDFATITLFRTQIEATKL
ncbi:hypothetical protein EYC84_009667 [Monilinia fructicola]|uniref:Uncharacterized protein n=1 Tax=Monilinia fructicola TaxID=38448 RepID=A0A5M9J8A7_MONFR|nr:hypothetical protein EYC84_009667 [Monilinia fructicola]